MDLLVPPELEELILCSCCHLPFNDTDAIPKLFSCRHHFCLKCVNSILLKGNELYCVHCWKRTELPGPEMKSEHLPTYDAILYLSQNLSMLNTKSKPPDKQQQSVSGQPTVSNLMTGNGGGSGCNSNNNSNSVINGSGPTSNSVVNGNKIKKGENCMTHAMPNTLWCTKCMILMCRACAGSEDHRNHNVKSQLEAKENINTDISNELLTMQKTLNELQHLVLKQRDFLLKILESCTALKTQIETELINHIPTLEIAEMRESLGKAKLCLDMLEQQSPTDALKLYTTLNIEKQRLQSKYQEMYLQCKLDDLIRNYGILFDFDLIKQALAQLHTNGEAYSTLNGGIGHHNPILLLANYCISQLYSRHVLSNKHHQLLSNGNNNYHQLHHQLQQQQSQSQQQQAQLQQQQTSTHQQQQQQQLSLHPTSHDSLVVNVKTYADITSSPKCTQQHSSISINQLHTSSTAGAGSSSSSASAHHHSGVLRGPSSGNSSAGISYIGSELNGLTVPSLTVMQHHLQSQQQQTQQQKSTSQQQTAVSVAGTAANVTANNLLCQPSVHVYPIYYFNIEMNGQPCGRILIEVRNDVAPKMSKNFGALAMGELGFGYKGCQIFQCWENESIITGDFELNNGRGGRSVFEEGFFMPDDTKILAIRGSVGMRRSQKRHDNLGLVGSQFRIILREMRGFTGIFAFVIEGLELVEKISQAGDSAGKPQSNVVIVNCGKFQ